MGEAFGKNLKKIRLNKGYTQKFMAEGIMDQSSYSKIEKGLIEPLYSKYISLLDKIDMTEKEFHYLYPEPENNERKKLIQEYFRIFHNDPGQLYPLISKLEADLTENENAYTRNVLQCCRAQLALSHHNMEAATEWAVLVWQELEKRDDWFLSEIKLINSILYLFPSETALSIMELALKKLQKYSSFSEGRFLWFHLKTNYILILMDSDEFAKALVLLDELIEHCLKEKKYRHLVIARMRKAIILKKLNKEGHQEMLEQSLNMLDYLGETQLKQELLAERRRLIEESQ